MHGMLPAPRWRFLSAKVALLVVGAGLLAWPAPGIADTGAVQITVSPGTLERIIIDYQLGEFTQTPLLIDGQQYMHVALGDEGLMKELVGAPELPHVCRSVIIPNDAEMAVNVLASKYYEITDVKVPPSKGFISRQVNPDDMPYTFGKAYEIDAFYPARLATLREPYILRDYRGVVVQLHPFQYNPVTCTLRVYTSVTVEVVQAGLGQVNVLQWRDRELSLAFHKIYARHFLNYAPETRYAPLDESGDMLIICYDSWLSNIQPLVDHKNNTMSIATTAVGVSTIGNNPTSIKDYIQNQYDTGDLAFVLLVGDAEQVAPWFASGGASDPSYSKLAGSDHYPDIMVGRFSAQTSAQVDTQVLRTIEYETMPATEQTWFKKGTGVASNQGPGHNGEYDNEHMDFIRDDLLAYGYTTVDRIYDPTATDTQVTNALNAGRGIVNYCGHGSATSWSTTGFNNADVSNLVNDNMLPFICSVACNNGEFDNYATCFAEAWLRATNGSEPTGAVAIYASSISQTWNPPMDAQDEFVDLLVAEQYFSFGALCFAGSCKMIDINGSGGVSMFDTWHVFGDPSLRVSGEPVETCDDGIQNQGEDRIDCGGPCPPCDCLSDGECSNGVFCDGAESCDAYGHCQPGTAVDCDDSVACTDDSCNEVADSCDNIPDDAYCDDGLFCTGVETCDPLANCQPGADPCPGQDCDEVNDVCVPPVCDNDGTCELGEDCNNCPNDCISGEEGGICGNGVCESPIGEDCVSCPGDCNGKQVGATKRQFCCGDGDGTNPVDCGDPRCSEDGFACSDLPAEPYCCGDLTCEGAEDSFNCAVDCGAPPFCGDDSCDAGEDQCNCPEDCGAPPASEAGYCTDGIDNDCDHVTDCLDDDCIGDPACPSCLPKGESCTLDSECCSYWCHKGACK